jgi:hypothetical protein
MVKSVMIELRTMRSCFSSDSVIGSYFTSNVSSIRFLTRFFLHNSEEYLCWTKALEEHFLTRSSL